MIIKKFYLIVINNLLKIYNQGIIVITDQVEDTVLLCLEDIDIDFRMFIYLIFDIVNVDVGNHDNIQVIILEENLFLIMFLYQNLDYYSIYYFIFFYYVMYLNYFFLNVFVKSRMKIDTHDHVIIYKPNFFIQKLMDKYILDTNIDDSNL